MTIVLQRVHQGANVCLDRVLRAEREHLVHITKTDDDEIGKVIVDVCRVTTPFPPLQAPETYILKRWDHARRVAVRVDQRHDACIARHSKDLLVMGTVIGFESLGRYHWAAFIGNVVGNEHRACLATATRDQPLDLDLKNLRAESDEFTVESRVFLVIDSKLLVSHGEDDAAENAPGFWHHKHSGSDGFLVLYHLAHST